MLDMVDLEQIICEVSLADLDTNEISLEGKTIIIGVKEGIGGVVAPVGGQYDYTVIVCNSDSHRWYKYRRRTTFLLELGICFLLGCVVILTRFTYYIVGGLMFIFSRCVYYTLLLYKKLLLIDVTWILVTILFVGLHSIFNRFILEFRLKQQIRKQFETYLTLDK